MNILGISAFYHDSAAAIIRRGEILAAAQEERFTRIKHDASFPINAIKFCLQHAGLQINQLDAIAFYDKPFLKFERLLETYYEFAPRGLVSFLQSMPVWLREKIFLRRIIHQELSQLPGYEPRKVKLLFPEHHLSHAASAFFASPFSHAAILTIDGVGEWATASICKGEGNGIEIIRELRFPHSLGLLYSAFTYYLGFKVNSGEYKMMGLAPYGIPDDPQTQEYIKIIRNILTDLKPDGSLWLNQEYFGYATGLRMADDAKWEKLFGFRRKNEDEPLQQHHCNLAYAIQAFTEEAVLLMAAEALRITNSRNLCMAGGVALNCVANGKVLQSGICEKIFIQPAAGDAGGALGAALAAHHIYFGAERTPSTQSDAMQGAFLGPAYSDLDIEQTLRKFGAPATRCESAEVLYAQVAALISRGNVVGWFQGRAEFGPRALGNRSILADARHADMQKKLNLKIKYREGFRPFAPAVLAEDAPEYFDLQTHSPYMLLVAPVKNSRRHPTPDDYHRLPLLERLYTLRSDIPAVTHVDFSARVQTVHKETNPAFYALLVAFKQLTGYGILINTSFNVRGEPPVCTPEDAYRCFMRTEMDYLILNNFILAKQEQPEWRESDTWKEILKSD
ncbi:MAG: carbamoyltransferase [Chitinophagales bacterium]|nr:carbamoyltransferase [Chitinophagales bacterium]MDW8417831.1 carbamoyltransferase [Chitinophagales bacterium]